MEANGPGGVATISASDLTPTGASNPSSNPGTTIDPLPKSRAGVSPANWGSYPRRTQRGRDAARGRRDARPTMFAVRPKSSARKADRIRAKLLGQVHERHLGG